MNIFKKHAIIFLVCGIILISIVVLYTNRGGDEDMNKILEYTIEHFAKQYSIDSRIIKAIVMTESSGNPHAESRYARGLMGVSKIALQQVNLLYGLQYNYDDMYDIEKNLRVGILYFKWLYDYFMNRYPPQTTLIFTLMAYNWGIGNTVKWLKHTEPTNSAIDEAVPIETKNYIIDFFFWYNYFARPN